MNFSKEQKDYIIHALEHCEVLTGGRSSGKTLELIKQQNKEIERLNKRIKELEEGFKASTEDLCEESTKIEKAIEYITNAIENDDIEELKSARHLMLWNEDLDKLLEILGKGE